MPRKGQRLKSRTRSREMAAEMRREGFTNAAIARKLGVALRTVKEYHAANRAEMLELAGSENPDGRLYGGRDRTTVGEFEHLHPKKREEMAPEVVWCLEDTPEGYRRFNDRYWPDQPMPRHIFEFVQACFDYLGSCCYPDCGAEAAYETRDGPICDAHVLAYRLLGGTAALKGAWKVAVIVTCPPNHAKSTYFNSRWCVWRISQNRDWRIIVISETGVISQTFVDDAAMNLDSNEQLIADVGPFRAETHWQPGRGAIRVLGSKITRGFNIYARGWEQQIQSLRADELILDDIIGPDDVKTPDRRADTVHKYEAVLVGRLGPGGITRVVATRQHIFDFYDSLKKLVDWETKAPVFYHVDFPAVRDWESHEVLWPEFWPFKRLMAEKRSHMSAAKFELVYQQNPRAAESTLLRPEDIYGSESFKHPPGCLDRDRRWGYQPLEPGWVRILSVDPSPTEFWAIIAMDVRETMYGEALYEVRIMEIVRQRMSLREAMPAHFARMLDVYRPSHCVAEINAFARWLGDDLEWQRLSRQYSCRLMPHTTSRNKADNDWGFETLAADFEFGRIRIPYASDPETLKQARYLIDEALNYPQSDTDDVLMALWMPKPNLLSLRVRRMLRPPTRQGGWHVPPRLAKRSWLAGANDGPPEFLVPAGSHVTIPIGDE